MTRAILKPLGSIIAAPALLAVLAAADGERVPSIRALMHKQYTVSSAPFKIIGREVDAQPPDWEKVRQAGEKFAALAATLAKHTPGEGSQESWRRLIDRHLADAKAIEGAAKSHDLAVLRDAHRRIAASCKTCHDAHRFGR
jgi:cytochrome c556